MYHILLALCQVGALQGIARGLSMGKYQDMASYVKVLVHELFGLELSILLKHVIWTKAVTNIAKHVDKEVSKKPIKIIQNHTMSNIFNHLQETLTPCNTLQPYL